MTCVPHKKLGKKMRPQGIIRVSLGGGTPGISPPPPKMLGTIINNISGQNGPKLQSQRS